MIGESIDHHQESMIVDIKLEHMLNDKQERVASDAIPSVIQICCIYV